MASRPRENVPPQRSRKRPRILTQRQPEELRSVVLGAFSLPSNDAAPIPSLEPTPACHLTRDSMSPVSLAGIEAVGALRCISCPGGKEAVEQLESKVKSMTISLSEAGKALLDGDDLEEVGTNVPLCCIAYLLRKGGIFCLDDLVMASLRARAKLEIERENTCECNGTSGLEQLIKVVFETEGASKRRDELLKELMHVYVVPGSLRSEADYLLACRTSDYLLEYGIDRLEIYELVESWVGMSLMTPCEESVPSNSDSNGTEAWTADLVELATGGDECDLLRFREEESAALLSLYTLLDVGRSVRLITRVVDSVGKESEDSISGCSKRWPCVVLLARRACETGCRSDSNPARLTCLLAALSGALTASLNSRCLHSVAVVMTLARVFTRVNERKSNTLKAELRARRFCLWLQQVLEGISRTNTETLCLVLAQLVPFEPLCYLRPIVSTLRRRADLWVAVREYVTHSRRRINDLQLKERASRGFETSDITCAKPIADVVKYVHEFARKDARLPARLIREMNFHRYYFRTNIVETLLAAELRPPREILRQMFPRGGLKEFNSARVSMIRLIAFDRRDGIITEGEANGAIENIESSMEKDDKDKAVDESRENEKLPKSMGTKVLVGRLIDFLEQSARRNGNEEALEGIKKQLVCRLQEQQGKSPDSFSRSVYQFLSLIIEKIISGGSQAAKDGPWRSMLINCGSWLQFLIKYVILHQDLVLFRFGLQRRVLLLLCAQINDLSLPDIVALSLFLYSFSKASKLVETGESFTEEEDIVELIAADLPLDNGEAIEKACYFVIQYLTAATSTVHEDLQVRNPSQSATCNRFGDLSRESGSVTIPMAMVQLLRWVACCPYRLTTQKRSGELLRLVQAVIKTKLFSDNQLTVGWWVKLELRAGYGCTRQSYRVLSKFLEQEGSVSKLAAVVAYHLALGDYRDQFGNGDWIRLTLLRLAKENIVDGSSKDPLGQSALAMGSFELLVCNHGPRKAELYLQLICSISENILFTSSTRIYMAMHLCNLIMPCVWPLNIETAKMLLPAIVAGFASTGEAPKGKESRAHGGENSPLSYVASAKIAALSSLAVYWKEVGRRYDGILQWRDGTDVLSRAKDIWIVLTSAIQHEEGALENRSVASMASLAADNPGAVGAAIVLFVRKMFELSTDTPFKYIERLERILSGLSHYKSGNIGVSTVLDVIIDICARVPLAAVVNESEAAFARGTKWSKALLIQAVQARCSLLRSFHTNVPEIGSCQNRSRSVALTRRGLGLTGTQQKSRFSNFSEVHKSSSGNGALSQVRNEEEWDRPERCIQSQIWAHFAMLRIAGALGSISDEALKVLFEEDSLILQRMLGIYVRAITTAGEAEVERSIGKLVLSALPSMERDVERTIKRLLKLKRRGTVTLCTTESSRLADVLKRRSPYLYAQIYQGAC